MHCNSIQEGIIHNKNEMEGVERAISSELVVLVTTPLRDIRRTICQVAMLSKSVCEL